MDNDSWTEDFNSLSDAETRLSKAIEDEKKWGRKVGKKVEFKKAEGGENSITHYETNYGYHVGISKFD